jgi:hypothetical protein
MMIDLNSLAIFAKVVEARSFSEAAKRLKLPISKISAPTSVSRKLRVDRSIRPTPSLSWSSATRRLTHAPTQRRDQRGRGQCRFEPIVNGLGRLAAVSATQHFGDAAGAVGHRLPTSSFHRITRR